MRSADRLLEQLRARGGVVEGSSKDLARELGCGTDRSLRTALMDLETRGLARRATRPGQRVLRLEVANLGTPEGLDPGSSAPRKDKPGKSEATSEVTSEAVARSSSKDSKRNEVEGAAAAAARPRKVGSEVGSPEGDAPAWRVVESTLADLRAERARVDALQRESLELAAELLEAREEIATLRVERGRVSPENEVSPCTVSSPTPRPVGTAPEPARSATASSAAPSPCAAPAATPTLTSSSTDAAPPVAVAVPATAAQVREAAEEELLLHRRRGKKVDFPEPWLKPKIEEMQADHERVFDVLARKKERIAQDAREAEAIKKRGEENAKTRAALGIDESVLAKIREEAREAEVKRAREALAS